jgi:hypothetical protein
MIKIILLISFIIFTILGCYEYHEELWIEHDLSGKMTAIYVTPLWINFDSVRTSNTKRLIDSLPGIDLLDWSDKSNDSNRIISFSVKFTNVDSLHNLVDPTLLINHFANISVKKNWRGDFVYSREIAPIRNKMPQFMIDNRPLIFDLITHIDGKIKKTKGEYLTYEKEGHTVQWSFGSGFPLKKSESIKVVFKTNSK